MAVKASATITIWNLVDINSTTWYYKLQSSTASAPSKPTLNTPTGWTKTEPTYTEGSTNTLYTTCKTTFSDDTFEYSDVSKSSSYEAAKTAYNKALAANNTANDTKDTVDNMEIGGRNLLTGTSGEWKFLATPITGTNRCYRISEFTLPEGTKTGDEFVLTFDIKFENFNSESGYEWRTYLQGSVDGSWTGGTRNILTDSIPYTNRIWKSNGTYHCVGIATVINDVNKKFEIGLRTDYSDGNGSIYVKNLKVEKGNKATDWSPAPEDIDDKFLEMNSTIQLEKNSILASVSSTYATNAALGNEVENIEAMLELKINSADLVSELNASADVITFNSNRLVINSDNFKLTSSGDVTATSGTIGGFTVTADKLYNSTGGANNYVGLGKKDAAWAFWAGALDENSSATAPFRVGHDGTAYATKLTATGAILTNCTFVGSNDAIELSIKESDGWQIKLSDYETAVIMNANGFAVRSEGNYLYGGIDDLGPYGENGKRPSYSGHTHWAINVDDTKCGISGDGSNFRAYNDAGALKDNKVTCGSTSSRWTRVYAANSSISTSDRRLKTNISNYSDQYEKLFDQLNPVTYSWKNNIGNNDNHDRVHTGFIAQEVKEAMDSVGLTDKDFAAFCYDDFTNDPEWNPETTNGMTDRYSLAYEEFISLNTHMIQKTRGDMFAIASAVDLHQVQLDELEHEIYKLKNELSQLKQAQ